MQARGDRMNIIDKETLYNLYIEQEKTQKEIANIYNCDRKNIAYYLKKFEIKKSKEDIYERHFKTKPTIDKILGYLKNGYLINDIAKIYNLNRSTISKTLKENGYNMRNHNSQIQKQSQRMKEDNPFKDEETKRKLFQIHMRKRKKITTEKEVNLITQ